MNTGNFPRGLRWRLSPVPEGLLTHWLSAARIWYGKRREAAEARGRGSPDSLLELDARLLRDIGAPHALQARAQGRRRAQRDRQDDLHAGGTAGDWQGW